MHNQTKLAAEHFERLGYGIAATEHRTRWGMLDIVASDGDTIVFARVGRRRMLAARATPVQSQNIRRAAAAWLAETADRPFAATIRFDDIDVDVDEDGRLVALDHLEGAF